MELQSGFVLAVLVAAVLLMDRLGGSDQLGRRLYQVTLAAVEAFVVVAVTALIFNPGDELLRGMSSGGASQDAADKVVAAQTAQIAAGAIAVIAALTMMRRFTTLPIGIMLGGVLLVLFGGTFGPGGTNVLAIFGQFYPASDEAKAANALVLAGAFVALLWWGVSQYEPDVRDGDEEYDERAFERSTVDTDAE